jgi:signal transduction histidine kinase
MNIEFRTGKVAFQPGARLLKLIGSELISDEVLAVIELVKNAHDADASVVQINFSSITTENGEITISDDGSGMTLDTILHHWMVPAGTTRRDANKFSARGRRMLGEKGVGRFATDKLARRLELISRTRGSATEVRAVFDWDEFENDTRMLSEVMNHWEERSATTIKEHGTTLRLVGLRAFWSERMFRRLSTGLLRLRSPFQKKEDFAIHLESDEYPQYSGELKHNLLEKAPHKIEAVFDGESNISVSLNETSVVEHLWNGSGELSCGPVRVRLFAFDLETESLSKVGSRLEVRAWLREWAGVSVYRDGFRVWPYGEPHDDWLRLDQRRVNNPVLRLSNNQIVGFVEIAQDKNPELRDQTNREGLISNAALEDLRRLLLFVFQMLEAERQTVRHPEEKKEPIPTKTQLREKDNVQQTVQRLIDKAEPKMALELKKLSQQLIERDELHRAEVKQIATSYTELAALGQVTSGLSTSVRPVLEQLKVGYAALKGKLMSKKIPELAESLKALEVLVATASNNLSALVPFEAGNSKKRTIDIISEMETTQSLLSPMLAASKVNLELTLPDMGVLRVDMRPEIFQRLLHILASNAVDWMGRSKKREIKIVVSESAGFCEILFSDSGPGVSPKIVEKIFEPGFSRKEGGRGMGLTIARNIASAHGGQIEVVTDKRRHGANFKIILPRKRVRPTVID